jgi:hypothetical protein
VDASGCLPPKNVELDLVDLAPRLDDRRTSEEC